MQWVIIEQFWYENTSVCRPGVKYKLLHEAHMKLRGSDSRQKDVPRRYQIMF
jgi:hypothetical protein